jgi:hypothetical protein
MDKEAPTNTAAIIRGNLTSKTILEIVGETAKLGNIGDKIVCITCIGVIGYLPTIKAIKKRIIGKKIRIL